MTEPAAVGGAGVAGGEEHSSAPEPLAALWLATLQELAGRGAHDLRNALNAVSVNVEVARARSARGAPGEQIAPFAATAARELEGAAARAEALLALARPARAPLDLVATARDIARFLAGTPIEVRAGDASVPTEPPPAGGIVLVLPADVVGATTALPPDVARLALARAVLNVYSADGAVTLRFDRASGASGDIFLHVASDGARAASFDAALAGLAAEHAVQLSVGTHGIDVRFPRSAPDETSQS